MIRFSAFLVVVAVGLLVAGVVTSKLMLVYIAIGVSGVALLALGIGAAVNWRELTGKPRTADTSAQGPAPVPPDSVPVSPEPVPAVTAPAAPAAPAVAATAQQASSGLQGHPRSAPSAPVTATSIPSGPSRAGYLPAAEPPRAKPAAAPVQAAFTTRRETPAPGGWERRDDSIPAPPSGNLPSAEERPTTDAKGTAEPTTAATEPEPDSGIDPELTLVTGMTPAASAPPDSQRKQAEQEEKPGEAEPVGPDPSMDVTVVPGVPRYHNARCILIRFMGDSDLDKMTLAAARDAGCTACRACLPDQPEKSPE